MLARNGDLHGVNCYHLGLHGPSVDAKPYISTTLIEEILIDGLENFLTVAEDGLGLEPPLDLSVGWEGSKTSTWRSTLGISTTRGWARSSWNGLTSVLLSTPILEIHSRS